MILTSRLLYRLDMKLNKLASTEHQNIPLENKILVLNEALLKLIKKKVGSNNIYNLGLDAFKKRYEDLQVLITPFEKVQIKENKDTYNTYTVDLTKLQSKYMFPSECYCLASKGSCTNRKIDIQSIIRHGDVHIYMNNEHYKPSFEFQDTFAQITDNKLIIYTDGLFKITDVYFSYLRYPKKIDMEGYEDFDGSLSTTQNCELPDYLEDELVDLAVLELAISTENTPAVQGTALRLQNNE